MVGSTPYSHKNIRKNDKYREDYHKKHNVQRFERQTPPEVSNYINLNVQVTPDDRVISQSDDSNTSITTKYNRGVFR